MDKNRFGLALTVVALVIIATTVYLALYYAPLPQTSVESAGKTLSSLEGSEISVAGFAVVINIIYPDALDVPQVEYLSLADFTDYQRYVAAVDSGTLDEQWWTIRPIDVKITSGGMLAGPLGHGSYLSVPNGTNISVTGVAVDDVVGPNSEVTGFSIDVWSSDDVIVGTSPGQFSIQSAPIAQKIFYFHMPSAWVSYVAFFVTLVGSAMYLRSKDLKYDRLASSSAELGVLFATIAITTGPIWAKQEWGVYWRWDDTKLVTTFVLWLVYIGYLSLRAAMSESGTRARVGAVYGILGFVTVPMSLLSSRIAPLLRSSHPQVIATSSGGLSPEAGLTVGVAVIAFTLLFAAMLIKRVELAESEEEIEDLKRIVGGEE